MPRFRAGQTNSFIFFFDTAIGTEGKGGLQNGPHSACFPLLNVSVIDQAGMNLLRFFVDNEVLLQGSGIYTSFILDRIKKQSPTCWL